MTQKRNTSLKYLIILSILFATSCNTTKKVEVDSGISTYLPPIIIYKTKKDYYNNVPVILSDDKTKIVSFPDIRDLRNGDSLKLP
ncbi:MAG: hypothetical protein JXR58_10995, partial [Bacteroidales bacterium]|nr:hypothetical protein [Bacteroidales bacterium]